MALDKKGRIVFFSHYVCLIIIIWTFGIVGGVPEFTVRVVRTFLLNSCILIPSSYMYYIYIYILNIYIYIYIYIYILCIFGYRKKELIKALSEMFSQQWLVFFTLINLYLCIIICIMYYVLFIYYLCINKCICTYI